MKRTFIQTITLATIITVLISPGLVGAQTDTEMAIIPGWQQIVRDGGPSARFDHALVATGDHQKLVLFGGRSGIDLNDTWIYEIESGLWYEVMTDMAPDARSSMGAAYDAAHDRVLIFGGQQSGTFNDVWAFDVSSETWTLLATTGIPPAPRYGTSAVVDADGDRLIISHGFSGTRFDDTFALDLTTNTWTDISPQTRPLRRCLHEAAFDALTGQMLLYGGCSSGSGPCPQGDLWSYNVVSATWTLLDNGGPSPVGRSNPSLVTGSEGQMWLFGGLGDSGPLGDLWALDPVTGTWTSQDSMDTNVPSPRRSHDATWDSVNEQMFIFGGTGSNGALDDLWVFVPETMDDM